MILSALKSHVSFQEKILFTKHLATMYKSGIPLPDALVTLVEQTKSKYFQRVISAVLEDVNNGQSLAKSLEKYPHVFDNFYVSLVDVSEQSGTLEDNLDFLSKQLTKDYKLRKKVLSALLYPGIVLGVMGVMGVFISIFVLPKLVDFFQSFQVELPLTTKILLFIANTFKSYGILIVVGIIAFFVGFRLLVVWMPVAKIWHRIIIKLPFVGNLIAYNQVARFTRNFGTLIKSGVPISEGLEITAGTLSNLKFQEDLAQLAASLTKGKSIGREMHASKYWEYPPIVSRMISVGEKTGRLDEVLLYLGDFYEEEIDDLSRNLSTVLEPILLIIIALMVGFVALAIISPIYELTGSIQR